MADAKISELTELTSIATDDLLVAVDVSETPDVTKKITVENLLDIIYPVGSVYISVSSTSPATLFGGTWSAFGAGKTLVGIDAGDTDFDTAEETGGAKTHTLTEAQMPTHNHDPIAQDRTGVQFGVGGSTTGGYGLADSGNIYNNSMLMQNKGGGQAHNNLQPYIVTYMWKRTA